MKLTVELTQADLAMVALFGSGPLKKHQVVTAFVRQQQEPTAYGTAQFERLKHLGVIDHRRDGRCWLSESFKALQQQSN